MNDLNLIGVVDAGNTQVKLGLFHKEKLVETCAFGKNQREAFHEHVQKHALKNVFVSTVLSDADNALWFPEPTFSLFGKQTRLPIKNFYETPDTLGHDRLINACAGRSLQPSGPVLIIDLGTCIKFDFVNDRNEYVGGSISPGLNMRFKALKEFTGKLPYLQPEKGVNYIGTNTNQSIWSGVQEGIQGEIIHFLNRYEGDYANLTVFITGGDAKFFDFPQKSNIFALENLTLKGLFYIYKLNE